MMALLILVAFAVVMDLRFNRIPNWLTLLILVWGLCSQILVFGLSGAVAAFGGIVVGLVCFVPLYMGGGMGAGDVKLMSAIGSFFGIKLTLIVAVYTLVAGGLMALVVAIYYKNINVLLFRYCHMAKVLIKTRQFVYFPPETGDPGEIRFAYALAIATGMCLVLFQIGFFTTLFSHVYGGV